MMGVAHWWKPAVAVAALVALLLAGKSWLEAHEARVRMEATVAAQQQIIAQADQREKQRAEELKQTLAQIEELKRTVQTPQQVIREISKYAPPLPQPIEIKLPETKPGERPTESAPATATIPQEDLKPLFDFVQDCRACKVELAAAAADHADDQVKMKALSHQRDAAVKAARGGGFWVRLRRSAKWLIIGGAVGYLAAKAH